jgi:hypothetical protein
MADVNHFVPQSRQVPPLRHPLPARPELTGVAAGEVRHDALRDIGGCVIEERACGAVRHGEMARVDGGARPVEGQEGELVDARHRAEAPLVGDRGQPPLGGGTVQGLPGGRDPDLVHVSAPRVVGDVAWRVAFRFTRQDGQRSGRRLSELAPARKEPGVQIGRQQPRHGITERRVRVERVRQPRRVLPELRRRIAGHDQASIPRRNGGRSPDSA